MHFITSDKTLKAGTYDDDERKREKEGKRKREGERKGKRERDRERKRVSKIEVKFRPT